MTAAARATPCVNASRSRAATNSRKDAAAPPGPSVSNGVEPVAARHPVKRPTAPSGSVPAVCATGTVTTVLPRANAVAPASFARVKKAGASPRPVGPGARAARAMIGKRRASPPRLDARDDPLAPARRLARTQIGVKRRIWTSSRPFSPRFAGDAGVPPCAPPAPATAHD